MKFTSTFKNWIGMSTISLILIEVALLFMFHSTSFGQIGILYIFMWSALPYPYIMVFVLMRMHRRIWND